MAGVTVRVEDAQVRAALASLAGRLGNMQPILDAIGGRLIDLARVGFTREQAPDGTPWKPLAASTQRDRARSGHWPGPILRVSGMLFSSLAWLASASPVEAVELGAGGNGSRPYAAMQLFGGQVRQSTRSQTLAFDKGGRFLSHKAAGRRKKGAVAVRFAQIGARTVTIPARPYLPTGGTLPDAYLASCLDAIQTKLMEAVNG